MFVTLSRLSIPVFAFTLVACSTFKGPGSFGGPNKLALGEESSEYDEETAATGGPTVTWSGAREYEKPDQPFEFDWPLDDAKLSRGFMTGGKRSHWGLDLANKKNTPILAAERGVVIYTGRGFRGFGNLVVIEHNEEWATLYAHLNKFSVKEGDTVKRGQNIGLMGRTGRATGVHLHFEIRHNRQPVNPMAYLPGGLGPAETP